MQRHFLRVVYLIITFHLLSSSFIFAQDETFKIYEDSFDIKSVYIGQYLFDSPTKINYLNLDTFTPLDHIYEIDRKFPEPMMSLGNQGSPIRYFNWNVSDNLNINFGINAFDPYFYSASDNLLYKVDRPYTELFIAQGKAFENSNRSLQNNMTLEGVFSRNLAHDMNLFMKYRKLKEAGPFSQDENEITAFQTGLVRMNEDSLRWKSALTYTFNELEREENGGISDHDSLFNDPDNPIRLALGTHLQDASSRYTTYNLEFKNRFNLLHNTNNAVSISHAISAEKSLYKYYDKQTSSQKDSAYYNTFLVGDQGIRSVFKRDYLKNEIRLSWQQKVIKELAVGANLMNYEKSFDNSAQNWNEFFVYGIFNITLGNFTTENNIHYGLQKTNPSYLLSSNTEYDLNKIGKLNFSINLSSTRPGLVYERLDITQINIWIHNWQNTNKSQFKLVYTSPRNFGSIGVTHNDVSDYLYFDQNSIPQQDQNKLTFQEYFIQSNLKFRDIGLNNQLYYRSKDKIRFIYTPQFHTIHELYYTHKVFNNNTILRTGIEGRYYYNYILPKYNPIVGNFYPSETNAGFRMLLDYYVNIRLPQFKLFVKATNIMDMFQAQQYKWADNYPLHDWGVRFGIKWTYFN